MEKMIISTQLYLYNNKSIKSNLGFLIESFNKIASFNSLTVYGKSMGGFAASQNAQYIDHLVHDRSFCNLSKVIRSYCKTKIWKIHSTTL